MRSPDPGELVINLFLRNEYSDDDASKVKQVLHNASEDVQGGGRQWETRSRDGIAVTVQVSPTESVLDHCEDELGWLSLSLDEVPECMTITAATATQQSETYLHQIVLMLSMDLEYESTGVSKND